MEIKGNKKQQTEARIKMIGKKRFLEYGLKETMFRDIAKSAKMDRRTIYRYYPSKEHLLLDIATDLFRYFSEQFLDVEFTDEMSGFEKISHLFDEYFRLLNQTPELILFLGMIDMSVGQNPQNREIYLELDEYGKKTDERLAELIEEGQRDGTVGASFLSKETAITINNSLIALATRVAVYQPKSLYKVEGFVWKMLKNQGEMFKNSLECRV
jgi:AcrR family transcriptional regulator